MFPVVGSRKGKSSFTMVARTNADISFQAWTLRTESQCASCHDRFGRAHRLRTWPIQSKT